ncbi:trypsin-like serine protease [Stenotrophomonas sp.]|uniref:trypsin-like serine protease n=1 Tax=Stenotrophomonas sp. TaxID=69392 RepID=UPI00289C49A1|nr:trypsin-like serine protease [Stenotrophomonas sp.]
MKLWAPFLIQAVCICAASAQDAERHEAKSRNLLEMNDSLRIASPGMSDPNEVSLRTAAQVLLRDPAVSKAFERDVGAMTPAELAESLKGRVLLSDLSALASDADLRKSLAEAGIEPRYLRKASSGGATEVRAMDAFVRLSLPQDTEGRVILPNENSMIVHPQPLFPDTLLPGSLPAPSDLLKITEGNDVKEFVWRQGMRYAGTVAVSGAVPTSVCSGTVIAGGWLLTAAHCLTAVDSQQLPMPHLMKVYLPFQGGSEVVLSPRGMMDRAMKSVGVVEVHWIGQELKLEYPASRNDSSILAGQGSDLALLKLNGADLAMLPHPIPNVRLAKSIPQGEYSIIGYGLTNQRHDGVLSLLVGVRSSAPTVDGDVLKYGDASSMGDAGFCHGDSGGGAFVNRIRGAEKDLLLVGVISALGEGGASSAVCVVRSQYMSSVVSERNSRYICGLVPAACAVQ